MPSDTFEEEGNVGKNKKKGLRFAKANNFLAITTHIISYKSIQLLLYFLKREFYIQ
jgi:hypothetical protein